MISKFTPVDITENILSRLPVKSLLRFRGVCKAWCTSIDRSSFTNLHLNQMEAKHAVKVVFWPSGLNLSLLHLRRVGKKVHAELISLLDYETGLKCHQVIGSCNGLLCISHIGNNNNSMTVLNPSTRKYKDIEFDLDEYQRGRQGNCWPFKDNIYGSWYDKDEKDYNVMVIEFPFPWGVANVIAYSVSTKSLRRIKENIPYSFTDYTSSGVLVNGALHWIACCKMFHRRLILALNCATNCLYELSLPESVSNSELSLTAIRGQLYCVIFNHSLAYIETWVMEDYGMSESWVKLPRYNESLCQLGEYALKAYILLLHGMEEENVRKVVRKGYIQEYTETCACLESLASINIDR